MYFSGDVLDYITLFIYDMLETDSITLLNLITDAIWPLEAGKISFCIAGFDSFWSQQLALMQAHTCTLYLYIRQ
jgi:hypothetical protein